MTVSPLGQDQRPRQASPSYSTACTAVFIEEICAACVAYSLPAAAFRKWTAVAVLAGPFYI